MTIPEIRKELCRHKKVSKRTLYNYLSKLRIEPVGVRQCPQRYPQDTANRILKALGISTTNRTTR